MWEFQIIYYDMRCRAHVIMLHVRNSILNRRFTSINPSSPTTFSTNYTHFMGLPAVSWTPHVFWNGEAPLLANNAAEQRQLHLASNLCHCTIMLSCIPALTTSLPLYIIYMSIYIYIIYIYTPFYPNSWKTSIKVCKALHWYSYV